MSPSVGGMTIADPPPYTPTPHSLPGYDWLTGHLMAVAVHLYNINTDVPRDQRLTNLDEFVADAMAAVGYVARLAGATDVNNIHPLGMRADAMARVIWTINPDITSEALGAKIGVGRRQAQRLLRDARGENITDDESDAAPISGPPADDTPTVADATPA